jgi:UDP-N-acetylglucosamine acyltransferase
MISPLSSVHSETKLGANVQVDPFTVIHKNVVIGDNTWIGNNVTIFEGARIGKNCKIFPGAVISAEPQDLKFEGEETTAEIGDNTIIREFVTMNRGTKALGKTVIGNNNLLMAYVHVAHDCIVGNHCILANGVTLAGHIVVDDFAIIGGLSAIHQFVHIGSHVMISGGSLVRKDVPPFTKAAREPLSYVGINSVGLRRRGYSNERISDIQNIYRILYQKGYNSNKALELIEAEVPGSSDKTYVTDFIKGSQRGIMKGYQRRSEED